MFASYSAIIAALLAAVLFGASTPFAKVLLGDVSPLLLAALLYLGSGLGLWSIRLVRRRRLTPVKLGASDRRWFLGAIVGGGMVAPILLMLLETHEPFFAGRAAKALYLPRDSGKSVDLRLISHKKN